jgi:hypothetical protein
LKLLVETQLCGILHIAFERVYTRSGAALVRLALFHRRGLQQPKQTSDYRLVVDGDM